MSEVVKGELHEASRRFMGMFDLDYPIIQAPMDGPATARLATAVCRAGALGSLPLTWRTPDQAYDEVRDVLASSISLPPPKTARPSNDTLETYRSRG